MIIQVGTSAFRDVDKDKPAFFRESSEEYLDYPDPKLRRHEGLQEMRFCVVVRGDAPETLGRTAQDPLIHLARCDAGKVDRVQHIGQIRLAPVVPGQQLEQLTRVSRRRKGRSQRHGGIPSAHSRHGGWQYYRFENWKLRRALALPYFLRSTTRASRVRKPPCFSTGRSPGS